MPQNPSGIGEHRAHQSNNLADVIGRRRYVLIALDDGLSRVGYVEKPKYDKLQKDFGEAKQKLEELQKKAEATPRHHYSLQREGLRTFRFDADTGETCIQLTTESDWKKPSTKAQSCACADALDAQARTYLKTGKLPPSADMDAVTAACATRKDY